MTEARSEIHICTKFTLLGKRWYFSGHASNAEIVAQSEIYNSRASVYKGIRAACAVFHGDVNRLNIYEDGIKRDAWGR